MISETVVEQIPSNQSALNSEPVSTFLSKENASAYEKLVAGKPDQQNGSLLSSWTVYTKYLWIILPLGTIILILRKIWAYKGFRRSIEAKCITVTDVNILSDYSDMYRVCKIGSPPPLYYTPLISTPMILGLIRPAIFLPINVTGDAKHILLHELIHYKRHDILYKLIVQVVVCLHWFNPLIWLFAREMEKDCEFACDEQVVCLLNNKRQYGDTLIASLNNNGVLPSKNVLAFNREGKFLKERLDCIMKYVGKKSRTITIVITAMLICISIFGGCSFSSPFTSESTDNPKEPLTSASTDYPKEMDNYVLKFKTDDYKNSLLSDFNQALLDDYEAANSAWGSFKEQNKEKEFYTSFTLSMLETSLYNGKNKENNNISLCTRDQIEGDRGEDVLKFTYTFKWNIPDMSALTVAERDKTVFGLRDKILEIVQRKINEGAFDGIEANDVEAIHAIVEDDIQRAAHSLSKDTITISAEANPSTAKLLLDEELRKKSDFENVAADVLIFFNETSVTFDNNLPILAE